MFLRSVRFKILFIYMVLLALTLFLFSLLLYGSFNKILIDDLDDLLSSKADGAEDSIRAYWHTKDMGLSQDEKKAGIFRNDDIKNFITIAREWVEEKRKDPELMSIFVQILDNEGKCLVSSKSFPLIAPLSKEDFDDVIAGEDTFDTFKGQSAQGKQMKFRLYTKPVPIHDKTMYVVEVAAPVGLVSLALQHLMIILFILFPLTIILAAAPGIFLAGMTLKPVDKMIDTLRRITAENLKLKIHIPDTKDEIKRLADTFNEMIERLDKSFSSQQNFIQDVSNELKRPIDTIKQKFKYMLEKARTPSEYESILLQGMEEIDIFEKIIDNLLMLAKFDNSQISLEIKKIDLTRLIEQILSSMRILAEEKDITISSFLQDTIIMDGDERQLKQLLMNLFDNAIKYTYRKGKITVAAHKDNKLAKITISDTGIGIKEDELPYIFDRFYQVKKARGVDKTFGLGLSIAKSIVEEHRGKIMAESQLGKGTTFIITLPLSYLV